MQKGLKLADLLKAAGLGFLGILGMATGLASRARGFCTQQMCCGGTALSPIITKGPCGNIFSTYSYP